MRRLLLIPLGDAGVVQRGGYMAPRPEFSASFIQINAVATTGREVRRVREEALKKIKGGAARRVSHAGTPRQNPLKDAYADLDAAVLDA